ncbi:MAG: GNAT family N-acetyltransferase [Oscillospiraceae bacterium]|nr:GNAT family N-acetyltransferase [Oscillospiraceae bacterium]
MTVRNLTPCDFDAHCRVSSAAFIWEYTPGEESFPENVTLLGCFDGNGELMADLEYFIRDATWGEGTVPCVCIGGVASLPHRRHGGAVRKLFEELERRAQAERWALGALYPFADHYYKQFGYERHFHSLRLTAPMRLVEASARDIPREARGTLHLYEGKELTDELLRVYNAFAAGRPLMLRREEAHLKWFFSRPFEKNEYCYLWKSPAGRFEGYLQYRVDRSTRTLHVGEFCPLNDAAMRGMLCFLRCYASQMDSVSFALLPPDTGVLAALGEYSAMRAELAFGPQLRFYGGRITPEALRKGPPPQFWDGF